ADILKYLPQLMMGNSEIKPEQLVDMQHYDLSENTKDALSMELESFVDCILNDKNPVVDGTAGMRALQIALQIMTSIQNYKVQ
ncbi:MAG: gfo/Idh/MocA family oxidoreductase, partial [Candidatus Cloacimonadaceae bacterium]|nr:gfo/Idh/MocA family oxidoreductase [Candidatus Cloacimonadaceae bacterium]